MAVVSLYPSVDLQLSLAKFWSLFLALAIYFAIVNVRPPHRVVAVATWLIPLAVAAVAALGLVGSDWNVNKGLVGARFYAHLPSLISKLPQSALAGQTHARGWQPNELAGTLAFLVPLVVGMTLWSGNKSSVAPRLQLLRLASIALGLGVLALTQSRSGYLGAATALLVLGFLRWRWRVLWIVPTLAVAAGLIYVAGVHAGMSWTAFVHHQRVGITSDIASRLELWNRAWDMIQDFPFTGIGLNTFPIVLALLYPTFLEDPSRIPHAHNFFLQTAVDFGLPGLGAMLAMLWGTSRCVRFAWKHGGQAERGIAAGVAGGLIGFLVFGLTDAVALGARPTFLVFGAIAVLVVATLECQDRLREQGNPSQTSGD